MIEKLKDVLKEAKYMVLSLTDLGEEVQISVTIRPKDGSEAKAPLLVKTNYMLADISLLEALKRPPKAGKTKELEKNSVENKEEVADLFGMEE